MNNLPSGTTQRMIDSEVHDCEEDGHVPVKSCGGWACAECHQELSED